MTIIVGSDKENTRLKNSIVDYLIQNEIEVMTLESDEDFVDATLHVSRNLKDGSDDLGIVVDSYGVGSFMVASKLKGMVAAVVTDERTAYMTRGHNNSRMISIGSEVVGTTLAHHIALGFAQGKYDGGRHQIRVDMLNAMG